MKADIHPKYQKCEITCACGAKFNIDSTKESIQTEVCSQCHPFYTGKQRLIQDNTIERFQKRMANVEKKQKEFAGKDKRAKNKARKEKKQPKTETLKNIKKNV